MSETGTPVVEQQDLPVLGEMEATAIRTAAANLRGLSLLLPDHSAVAAEMRRWATELFHAAEEHCPAAEGELPPLRLA